MPDAEDPRFIVSSSELDGLTELFCLFEGGDFNAARCGKQRFYSNKKSKESIASECTLGMATRITSITFWLLRLGFRICPSNREEFPIEVEIYEKK
jgi:hypothetical protein